MRYLIAALFIAVVAAPLSPSRAESAAKPAYLLEAEHNYRQALAELRTAQSGLGRLTREETQRSRRAVRQYGQWIEPGELWRAKSAAQERLTFAQENAQQSFEELNRARDAARRERIGALPQPEPLSSPFWWLW